MNQCRLYYKVVGDEREYEQEVELWPQEERRTRTRETELGEPGSLWPQEKVMLRAGAEVVLRVGAGAALEARGPR